MDYEFYAVDPYTPLDPKIDIDTYRDVLCLYDEECKRAVERVRAFFTPRFKIGHLDAFLFGRDLMVHCRTVEDIENTLLRDPNSAKTRRKKR